MISFLHILLFSFLVPSGHDIVPCKPYQLTLQTVDGNKYPLKDLATSKATVFVFLLPDCPACESYAPTLNKLSKKYSTQGVRFIGVVPGNYATRAEITVFQKTYKPAFPIVTDTSNKLVKCLGARIVPEAFVVNSKGVTVYAGRIDDWMVALGKKKRIITAHDLDEAIVAVIENREVKVKMTKAIGCFIE